MSGPWLDHNRERQEPHMRFISRSWRLLLVLAVLVLAFQAIVNVQQRGGAPPPQTAPIGIDATEDQIRQGFG